MIAAASPDKHAETAFAILPVINSAKSLSGCPATALGDGPISMTGRPFVKVCVISRLSLTAIGAGKPSASNAGLIKDSGAINPKPWCFVPFRAAQLLAVISGPIPAGSPSVNRSGLLDKARRTLTHHNCRLAAKITQMTL